MKIGKLKAKNTTDQDISADVTHWMSEKLSELS